MSTRRRTSGDETWNRLLHWTDSQKAAERLAGHVLKQDGFTSIDPSQPLGGPDGLADIVCQKEHNLWVAAVYFPNGEQPFSKVRSKFEHDIDGVSRNKAHGFVFVTNQYLTNDNRAKLKQSTHVKRVEIYHLERITHILDSPTCYSIRSDYLGIEMTKEDGIAFFATLALRGVSDWERLRKELKRDVTEAVLDALSRPRR